jgi:hypothetical protein
MCVKARLNDLEITFVHLGHDDGDDLDDVYEGALFLY